MDISGDYFSEAGFLKRMEGSVIKSSEKKSSSQSSAAVSLAQDRPASQRFFSPSANSFMGRFFAHSESVVTDNILASTSPAPGK